VPPSRGAACCVCLSDFSHHQIKGETTLRMPLLFLKMLGQLRMAGFEQGMVEGEGAILAVVKSLGKLDDGRGPVGRCWGWTEGVAEDVASNASLLSLLRFIDCRFGAHYQRSLIGGIPGRLEGVESQGASCRSLGLGLPLLPPLYHRPSWA
jgi:hypothetical protein